MDLYLKIKILINSNKKLSFLFRLIIKFKHLLSNKNLYTLILYNKNFVAYQNSNIIFRAFNKNSFLLIIIRKIVSNYAITDY
jgi:hypothetical protein